MTPDLRGFLTPEKLLDRAVARALTRQPRYSSDSLFAGVHQLTERATATFSRAGLDISYPDPAEHVLAAREPKPGVDLVTALHYLLTTTVGRVPAERDEVGVELSGGADSANVALAVSALHGDVVRSYGLVVDGEVGAQQRKRRAALAQQLGLNDIAIPAGQFPPFAPNGVRALGVPHDPCAAYYREAFDRLRDVASQRGTRVMFTGLGGDELNARHPHEQPDDASAYEPQPVPWLGPVARAALAELDLNLAPVSPVPLPTLMAFGLHNPAYLTAGIWPVAPLAHPAIGRFAEQLPLGERRGKSLFRQRLRRAGFGEDVANPRWPETFSALMQRGLRRYGLPLLEKMLTESILVDTGHLDQRALEAAFETAKTTGTVPSTLCDAIAIECGLRSML